VAAVSRSADSGRNLAGLPAWPSRFWCRSLLADLAQADSVPQPASHLAVGLAVREDQLRHVLAEQATASSWSRPSVMNVSTSSRLAKESPDDAPRSCGPPRP